LDIKMAVIGAENGTLKENKYAVKFESMEAKIH
jgi:hypothetical protein